MKEIFEIFPHGVLIPFKSQALKKAHDVFDSLNYDLLAETLSQEEIFQRLESVGTLLHVLYEEVFIGENIIKD